MKLDTVREDKAILNVTSRLADTFADIHTPEDVEAAVRVAREQFADDPVREYVPILVERIVRTQLTPAPDPVVPETLAEPTAEQRGSRPGVALPAAIAGVLVVATIATVVIVRNGDDVQASGITTVSGVIGSEKRAFFEDPDVQAALAKHGLAVQVDTAGSREIATTVDLAKYDFAFPSSTVAADRIQQGSADRPGVAGKKYAVFSSPMAIATYRPIANLLSATGIARQVNGVWYFDMRRYMDLAKAGWRWDDIRGNTTYPVRKRLLVTTTDPRTSNSAAMFLSIASYVANGQTVVQGTAEERKVLPYVTPLFVNQGYTDNSSEGPFEDYLSLGMGKTPLVCIYEAQFVDAAVRGKLKSDMVLMYPSPTVQSRHTLLSLKPNGDKLGELLSTDQELQQLAAQHGFRTADPDQFAKVVSAGKVPVAEQVVDVADLPTYDTLERLLNSVSKAYR
ncbi:three-helix bundle dimerization domain-containing protein [Kribbella sp. NPDC050124]|uniref:three-helix bundle dimerization domain-containing protein n=1 Tax=Kribbella sp. NPDC050124 TaxID=3364114 RepID=UPI00379441F9